MHCFNESHVFINMYELMIMKRKENCHWKKMHPFQKKKMGVLMIHRGHISEGSCHLCVTLFVRGTRVLIHVHTPISFLWLMCTIKNVTISQMSQTNVNFTNSPNLFWCLVLTINKSCNETCHRQSDRISEKIIKTKNSSYSLQIIAIDSYAKFKPVSSCQFNTLSKY